jgi:hypothetical protein
LPCACASWCNSPTRQSSPSTKAVARNTSEPSPAVVAEVKTFLARHQAKSASVEATGLRFLFYETPTDEIGDGPHSWW